MTRLSPRPGCHDLSFRDLYLLEEPAEVALEDYAVALTRSERAEACCAGAPGEPGPRGESSGDAGPFRPPARIAGVHVCGAAEPPAEAACIDLEAFARDLAVRSSSDGLGWG